MVIISGLCSHTKNYHKIAFMRWLRQESDRMHQNVCCRHIRPSTSQWWCQWMCPSWDQ